MIYDMIFKEQKLKIISLRGIVKNVKIKKIECNKKSEERTLHWKTVVTTKTGTILLLHCSIDC